MRITPKYAKRYRDVAEEVASLRTEVAALREDLRAGDTPTPEGSKRDPEDFYGLNEKLKELI